MTEPETTHPPIPSDADVIGVRHGMFGVKGSGDTSGYGRLVREVALPGSSPRPYGAYFDEVVDALIDALGDDGFTSAVERVVVFRGELTLEVRREHLVAVARTLRDDPALRFELCLGVSGVHYPAETGRELHAVYPLNVDHPPSPHPGGGGRPGRRSSCAVAVFGVPHHRLA